MLVASVVAGAALSVTLSSRQLLDADQKRSQVNQDLHIGLDLLGIDLRQAGERLPGDFPAVELLNGTSGAPDTLIIRRNLLDEVMPLCKRIDAGTTTDEVQVYKTGTVGCNKVADTNGDTWPDNIGAWRSYRIANGGAVKAYVYNPVLKQGEFFVYDGDGSTKAFLSQADTGPWTYTYKVNQVCRVYVIEERRYALNGSVLQLVINEDTAQAQNVLDGVTDFQLQALLENGTTVDTLDASDLWGDLAAINVSVTGATTVDGETVTRTLTSQYFPRNVLSL
jgi:type IV pilus assembly protein PilW